MIAYLKGKIAVSEPTHVIIDIQGVGYEVKISLQTYSSIKGLESVTLQTYLHIKEDSHTLFGFHTLREKNTFTQLISINGVGPSTGLMILSSLSPEELYQAIVNEDVGLIQSVKGIGAKTAQRIILELKDKIVKEGIGAETTEIISPSMDNTLREEALSALLTLGFTKNVADKTISSILKKTGGNITLEELIKTALKTT